MSDTANAPYIPESRTASNAVTVPIEGGGVWGTYVEKLATMEARIEELEAALWGLLIHVGICDQRHYSDAEGIECSYVTEARRALQPTPEEK